MISARVIHGVEVCGVDVDPETRCAHYHSERDIIAIKFKCCTKWFPCYSCHAEWSDHPAEIWPKAEFETPAVLCGACGHQLTVHDYLTSSSACPSCRREFNAGCERHRHLYFEQ